MFFSHMDKISNHMIQTNAYVLVERFNIKCLSKVLRYLLSNHLDAEKWVQFHLEIDKIRCINDSSAPCWLNCPLILVDLIVLCFSYASRHC